jgi:hypothetical protein
VVRALTDDDAYSVLSSPPTWARARRQALRMERIPPSQRGRVFSVFRTMMQATPPVGAAVVTPLLVAGNLAGAVILMSALAALPAFALLFVREGRQLWITGSSCG